MGEKKKARKADNRALYRKYRSKSLDEIIGQEHITTTLKNAIKSGRISHAYLFTGPRGVGKTSIARILAHEINGIPYTDDSIELDIIEIDAASNRRIDDIRDLREKVNLAPVNSKYKVYIIDEVHMLTAESFNALLKTLEEPPEHVIFILATTEVHKLPATIISRTQRHTFRAVPKKQVVDHLDFIASQEDLKIEPGALELLAEHGEGSFRDSISLLDQISHLSQPVSRVMVEDLLGVAPADEIINLLEYATSGDTKKVIETTRRLDDSGISPTVTANQLLKQLAQRKPNNQLIVLMKDLLAVGSSTQQSLTLEIALLTFALSRDESQTAAKPAMPTTVTQVKKTQSPKTIKQPISSTVENDTKKQPIENQVKTEEVNSTKNIKSHKSLELEEFWPDILQEIKQRNSSLYTVMRLAKPKLDSDLLTLTFQFPFHKKRADDAKHLNLISEIVSNHINLSPTIETIVSSAKPMPAEELTVTREQITQISESDDSSHASLIASVQDIMGGGEIIDARNA